MNSKDTITIEMPRAAFDVILASLKTAKDWGLKYNADPETTLQLVAGSAIGEEIEKEILRSGLSRIVVYPVTTYKVFGSSSH